MYQYYLTYRVKYIAIVEFDVKDVHCVINPYIVIKESCIIIYNRKYSLRL